VSSAKPLASAEARSRGLLLAAAGAVAFSAKAIIVKLAYRHGVDAVTLLFYRMALALPLFLFMAGWAARREGAGSKRAPLSRGDALKLMGLGFIGYYLSSFLDFLGLQYVSASLERLILYLNPTLVLLLGALLYGKPVRARQLAAMAVSYAGVALVFGRELSVSGAHTLWGAGLIFLSTITYAFYMTASDEFVQKLGALRLVGLASSAASLCCIVQFFALRPLAALAVPGPVLWLSLINATLCTALPMLLVMMAIERIGPALTAQTGMIGPLATIAMGVIWLDEPFTPWLLAGTALVLAGIYLVTRPAGGATTSGEPG